MAAPGRVELPTSCFVGRRSIQLSYGTGNISTIALYFCKDEAAGFSVVSQFDFAYKQTGGAPLILSHCQDHLIGMSPRRR
jgi:hypothetical protein